MGIGPPTMELYRVLRDNGDLDGLKSVIELGSQDIPAHQWHQEWATRFVSTVTGKNNEGVFITAESFHRALGFTEYCCIDADGNNSAFVFDLNLDLRETYGFEKTFDLVTNHGTSEHIFNQDQCFKNMHNLLRIGGVALHVVPFEGYLNHGYFNYHPSMFIDIAIANQYELIGIWYHSQRTWKRFKYRANIVPLHYTDDLLSVLDDLCKEGKLVSSPLNNYSLLSVAYRKTSDEGFKRPFDARFSERSKLRGDYAASSIERRNKIYTTADHLCDIDRHMGQDTLKQWIQNVLNNPKNLQRLRSVFLRKQ